MKSQLTKVVERAGLDWLVTVDWEFEPGVAQLLERLRQAEHAVFARAGDVVKVEYLGQDGLVGGSVLEHAPVGINAGRAAAACSMGAPPVARMTAVWWWSSAPGCPAAPGQISDAEAINKRDLLSRRPP
ncbi:MAG: hypothetical protein IMZ73_12140 [Chloroflexi bacterium]|nr:hypothetical protein [Chloroflexota bacterium]